MCKTLTSILFLCLGLQSWGQSACRIDDVELVRKD